MDLDDRCQWYRLHPLFAADTELTQREREILALLERSMSNKRIALALNLSLETVKWNLKNIFGKLGVTNRYDAIVYARTTAWVGVVSTEPGLPSTNSAAGAGAGDVLRENGQQA